LIILMSMKPALLVRNVLIVVFGLAYTLVNFTSLMGATYQPPVFATAHANFFTPLSLNTSPWVMFTGSGTAVRFSQIAYFNGFGQIHADQWEKSGIDSLLPTAKEKFHGALVDVANSPYATNYLQYLCKHNSWGATSIAIESVWVPVSSLPLQQGFVLNYQVNNMWQC